MKESNKKIWKWIIQILVSALTGAGTAFGVSSCTVNSGNRETFERSPFVAPTQSLSNSNFNNSPVKTDTVKVIKETNTIYTQE